MAILTSFDAKTKTLTIEGKGNITWRQTAEYADNTEHIVIVGSGICSTNMSNIFANFKKLVDIQGHINTSTCNDFSYCYAECFNLVKPIEDLDTSAGIEFDFFHSDNRSLVNAKFNDTTLAGKMDNMFYGCESLKRIDGITIPMGIDISTMSNLEEVVYMLTELAGKQVG